MTDLTKEQQAKLYDFIFHCPPFFHFHAGRFVVLEAQDMFRYFSKAIGAVNTPTGTMEIVRELRQSATIMEPELAEENRRLAREIEKELDETPES